MITTNLSFGRPHELPFFNRNTFFKPGDLKRVLPDFVVDWMVETSRRAEHRDDLYYLPVGGRMPVVLAVRLSLSFPGLLSAVPLYRRYFALEDAEKNYRRMWFSDGGISSNFPVQMFDGWLPVRPTFGVSLDDFDSALRRKDRVYLPTNPGSGIWPPFHGVNSVPQFARAILGAAMNWQDQIQSLSPGFTDRIVHVALDEDEGGLNLTMSEDTIKALVAYGETAGRFLASASGDQDDDFNFEDHRWRRFLILYEQLEAELQQLAAGWTSRERSGLTTGQIIRRLADDPPSYKGRSKTARRAAVKRINALVKHLQTWESQGDFRQKLQLPRPAPEMKINARLVE